MTGCITSPFKLIGMLFQGIISGVKWCIEAGVKGWVILGITCFVLLIVGLNQCTPPKSNIVLPPKTINEPAKTEAPYYVTADETVYYMQKYHWQGEVILIIENYWLLKGNTWAYTNGAKALSGKLKVYRR